MSVQWVSSSVEPGTLPSQEMVGPEAARDGDTASPYGTKRKEREVSPSVGIAAVIAMNIKVRMLYVCGKAAGGTRDQSYTQEGCAARSRQGSVARVSKQRAHHGYGEG